MTTLQQDKFFCSDTTIEIKKVSLAFNLSKYLDLTQNLNKQRNLVKKLQYAECKIKRGMSIVSNMTEHKNHVSEHDDMDGPASSLL